MVNIIRGADKTVRLAFNQDGAPWSLVGVTAMEACFPGDVSKTIAGGGIAIIDAAGGIAEVTLTNDDTTAMNAGLSQPIEVVVDKGAVKKIFPVIGIVSVLNRIY